MKKIAVASGKGGTGKTTFSLILSKVLSENYKIQLVDCDVEEPNCHLFLNCSGKVEEEAVTTFTPEIDLNICDFCGKCVDVCEYKALLIAGKKFLKFNELCHPCKGCMLVCPKKAISDGARKIGMKFSGTVNENIYFTYAKMNVGEARAVGPISELKRDLKKDVDFVVLDSPPGASCPVVEVLKGIDFVVLVTEPTPFGFYDLKIACSLVKKLGIPFGIVINQSDGKDDIIEKFAVEERIEIIKRIPFSLEFAEKYSEGIIDVNFFPDLKTSILDFVKKL